MSNMYPEDIDESSVKERMGLNYVPLPLPKEHRKLLTAFRCHCKFFTPDTIISSHEIRCLKCGKWAKIEHKVSTSLFTRIWHLLVG